MEDILYFKTTDRDDMYITKVYQIGLNIIPWGYDQYPFTEENGFVFHDIESIDYDGYYIRQVILPTDDPEFKLVGKNKANRIILKERYELSNIETYHKLKIPYPPLRYCVIPKRIDLLKYLLKNVSHDQKMIDDAINEIIKYGYDDILQYFLDYGLTINFNNNMLVRAAWSGYFRTIQILIQLGANIRVDDDIILRRMTYLGNLDMVKYAVSLGADICARDNEAIILASEHGYLDLVEYLVQQGADITAQDNLAFVYACSNGYLEIAKYLVKLGADINARNNAAFIDSCISGCLDMVQYLVGLGIDITMDDDCAIRVAAHNGHLDVIKYLVELGADVQAKNNSPVRLAAKYGKLDVIKYLVSMGANIYAKDGAAIKYGYQSVIHYDKLEIIDYFISLGIDIKDYDDYALKLAIESRNKKMAKHLIQNGVDDSRLINN